jgi:hypothetical protein
VAAPSEPLHRDIEVIGIAIERFVFLVPLLFQEGVHAQLMTSARALVRMLPPRSAPRSPASRTRCWR